MESAHGPAHPAPSRYPGKASPTRIVLCGSSRFLDLMAVCAWLLERDESAIVLGLHLLPSWYPTRPVHHLADTEGVRASLETLHRHKIDLADEVFVVNKNGYLGASTRDEVAYAQAQNKVIRWYTQDPIGQHVDRLLIDSALQPGPPPSPSAHDPSPDPSGDAPHSSYP